MANSDLMSAQFYYSTEYTLDKAYLTECYQQTAVTPSMMQAYKKSIIFALLAAVFFYLPQTSVYWGSFFVGLAVIEALSVRFAQAWWVTRQLLGKSGNNPVTLTIDEQGIHLTSSFVTQDFIWQDIDSMEQTSEGLILLVNQQRTYLSKRVLSEQALNYLQSQIQR